jgi:hypothetical protein
MKRLILLAAVVAAFVALAAIPGAVSAKTGNCQDTGQGSICAGGSGAAGGTTSSQGSVGTYNLGGYSAGGHGGQGGGGGGYCTGKTTGNGPMVVGSSPPC